jgi:glycosyltransferase involved in cell wall biosynthesis
MASKHKTHLVMLTTAGRGGIRAVVDAYERDGVFRRWNAVALYSHIEGSLAARLLAALSALVRFSILLLDGRVALLHSHAAMSGSFWRKAVFAEAARMFGVPVVLHLHGSDMEIFYDAQGPLGRRAIKRQLEKADRVIVLSESWREFVARVAPAARSAVVSNYVDLPPWSACRHRHQGVNLLFLGILGQRKGIYDLLPAFRAALQRLPDLRLLIGGNGEVKETEDCIRAEGLQSSADLLGWVAGRQKDELLQTADAFVLPSYNEGLPIGILEAMAHGVPVISTRVGGIPELVRDGIDGVLIDAGDRRALEEALVAIGDDAARRERMGKAARARIEEGFSPQATLPGLEQIYRELVGGEIS